MTHFSKKVEILTEVWERKRHDPEFQDYIMYNDIGLPLAHSILWDLVTVTPRGKLFIEETFFLLVGALKASQDLEYDSLDDIIAGYGTEELEED